MKRNHASVKGLGRADLARATGCNLETIRYYEKIGLMPEPQRNASGWRVYGPEDVARLGFIMRARELGFSLDAVRDLLTLAQGGQSCAQVEAMARAHLDEVRARIARLERVEQVLAETVERCTGGAAPGCPVIEALGAV